MAYDAEHATHLTVDPLTLTEPRDRLIYMRDFLRDLPNEKFDMGDPGNLGDNELGWCQSPACIGGWTVARFRYVNCNLRDAGASLLGLSQSAVNDLFFPASDLGVCMGDGSSPYHASTADAADVLTHLIETGEVDWSVARS